MYEEARVIEVRRRQREVYERIKAVSELRTPDIDGLAVSRFLSNHTW